MAKAILHIINCGIALKNIFTALWVFSWFIIPPVCGEENDT